MREIDKALPSVTLLATATGSELATAVGIATTAISVFRLRAEEMPQVANQMTAALNLSKLTIDQVALGFQYVGNAAADMGLSLTETTAVLATLANQGIRSGSTIGTGFRQLLVDLQSPSENLRQRFRELNISMADVDIRTNGVVGVLENLRAAGFTSADAFATMELRGAAAFSALSRGADRMGDLITGIQQATGAAEANAIQMESLQNGDLIRREVGELQKLIDVFADQTLGHHPHTWFAGRLELPLNVDTDGWGLSAAWVMQEARLRLFHQKGKVSDLVGPKWFRHLGFLAEFGFCIRSMGLAHG